MPYNSNQIMDDLLKQADKFLPGYRADPTGKYGGKNRLETQAFPLEKKEMSATLRAMAYLRDKYGLPHPDPKTLAALALKEGRDDFGLRSEAFMPSSKKVADQIYSSPEFRNRGTLENSPTRPFSSFIYDKQGNPYNFETAIRASELMQKAKRQGKELTQLWNPGSKNYHKDFARRAYAAEASENAPLLDHIYSTLGVERDKLAEPQSTLDNTVSLPDNYRVGGRVRMI